MKKIKAFFYVFKNSLFNPNYYKEILTAPFSFSFKYFLFLFFLIGFLTAVSFSFLIVSFLPSYLNTLKTEIPNLYPSQLVINIKNGQVSTNVSQPYFVPLNTKVFPESLKKQIKYEPVFNLLVIDTSAQPTDIKKYQTLALLTKDSLALLDEYNQIRVQGLEEIKDFTLNRQAVDFFWQKITPFFKWITPLLVFLIILFFPLFIILGKFIYLLLISIITLILGLLFKLPNFGYGKALQFNFHLITLPTLIIVLFNLLGATPKIPFFQGIILFIFTLIVFNTIKEKVEEKK